MKLSKQRMAYVGVLGLGLVALAADRTVLGPAGASAAGVDPSELGPLPEAKPGAEAGTIARGAPSLSDRLAALTIESTGRDGFTPPASWSPVDPTAPVNESAATFARAHKLTSIAVVKVRDKEHHVAIVNGRSVAVGGRLGEFELTTLSKEAATFRSGTAEVTLRLPEHGRGSDER